MKYLIAMFLMVGVAACGQMPNAPAPQNGGSGFFKGGNYPARNLSEGGNPDTGGNDGK